MKAKLTRGQLRVYELLQATTAEVTAQEVRARLRAQGRPLGLATVYRAIKALQLQGLVQARALANGEWVYQLTLEDRHHLTCLSCGLSVPVEECPAHALEKKLAEYSQFTVFYHTLEFFGLCSACGGTSDASGAQGVG